LNVPQENIALKPPFVDLHIHSTASDGSLSPSEIIKTAEKAGLGAIAITDHDTLEGSAEALTYPESHDVEILPGIEFSANFRSGNVHILGYLIRLDDADMGKTLEIVQRARSDRNVKMLKKLQGLGFDVDYEEIAEFAGPGQIGRPHIAQMLMKKGIVQNVEEAFVRFLKKGRPAYTERYRLQSGEAIQAILDAGGVPVLAHPFSLRARSERDLEEIVGQLKKSGLKGVEAYYPGHGPTRTALYERVARGHGLVVTGGTDFHGAVKPGIHMGFGNGDLRVPYEVVDELKRAACKN
jgi:predicted metal-dependent phosphoesterase TrpH